MPNLVLIGILMLVANVIYGCIIASFIGLGCIAMGLVISPM